MDIRRGICPLCNHNEVIETRVAEFGEGDLEKQMCVTYDARWMLEGRNPRYGHGPLFLYTCRSCGYSQWFAADADKIPISSEHRTRIIKG